VANFFRSLPSQIGSMNKRRVGIVGFGSLGKFLANKIQHDPKASKELEVAFIWNRSVDKITQDKTIPRELILEDLSQFATRKPDIVVEVAHPSITDRYAVSFLQYCDFFLGSPTAFADPQIETKVKAAATVHGSMMKYRHSFRQLKDKTMPSRQLLRYLRTEWCALGSGRHQKDGRKRHAAWAYNNNEKTSFKFETRTFAPR